MRRTIVLASLLAASMLLARTSSAANPTCASVAATTGASILYVQNGDTQEPLMKRVAQKLLASSNVLLVYQNNGSCTITPNLYGGASFAANTNLSYVPTVSADGGVWDPSQPSAVCTSDATNPTLIDVGISALLTASCQLGAPPAGVGEFHGPVQAYTFIAPTTSTQTAIWAEEAYYAFGFGNANLILPWNNKDLMFIRPTTKSTLVATAFNILVPPNKWQGTPEPASSDVLNAVINSTTSPDPTIGILGDEVYDANRGKGAKVLAYRAYGQKHAYFPDSTDQSYDRQNVRDGHYTLWSPTVYITKVDAGGVPTNPLVKYLIDLVLGNESAAAPDGGTPIDALEDVVKVGLTPDCAMHVTRSTDGGDLSLYTPAARCDCYFATRLPGASGTPAGCTTCTGTGHSTCGAGFCHHGFCEVN